MSCVEQPDTWSSEATAGVLPGRVCGPREPRNTTQLSKQSDNIPERIPADSVCNIQQVQEEVGQLVRLETVSDSAGQLERRRNGADGGPGERSDMSDITNYNAMMRRSHS